MVRVFAVKVAMGAMVGLVAVLPVTAMSIPSYSQAQLQQQVSEDEAHIQALGHSIQQAQATAGTLAGQLAGMNLQLSILSGQVNATTGKINALQPSIDALQAQMDLKKSQLAANIRTIYTYSTQSTLEVLFSSGGLNEFMGRKSYLQSAQQHVIDLNTDIAELKKPFDDQKAQLEALLAQQAAQKAAYQSQVEAKQSLLNQTKGNERRYQAMLASDRAEEERLLSRIALLEQGGGLIKKGHVARGQIIGLEGSTGNSTGPHLHFSVYQDSNALNPRDFINAGSMVWPMPGAYITQDFGCTSFALEIRRASCPGGHFHDGIDLAAPAGTPIRAVADGDIIDTGDGGWSKIGFGHYVVIDHGNGIWSLYGHMLP